ncbi:MAG: response regulator [Desulfobacterales bacterium]|nr:response regulator [Desulfobacterales bacterium]
MHKKVLIVDDDRILLSLTENKLKKHKDNFTVLTAEDGLQAVSILKENHISLVVTDLHMPHMDGFALLAHLSEHYPDIPVVILTAYSSPNSKKSAIEGGAAEYLEKPFVMEELTQKIITRLAKESEGGILQTVPLEMFLQLVEMEQKTCTIRVTNKTSGLKGVLFFNNGELFDARVQDAKGLQSAYQILSWNNVALSIQDTCPVKTKQINDNLQAILMDSMRLKDEAAESDGSQPENPPPHYASMKEPELSQSHEVSPAVAIHSKLDKLEGEKKWLKEILYDNSWDNLTTEAIALGKFFKAGDLKSCYVNTGAATDYIILPADKTIVVSVNTQCPHDKIIQVLSE